MPDRSDLWGPKVRKWMTEWHSPVAGYTLTKASRGGSGLLVASNARVTDVTLSLRVIDVTPGTRVTDTH